MNYNRILFKIISWSLSLVLAFIAAAPAMAQEPSVAMTGETKEYSVDLHLGSNYLWTVYSDPSFSKAATPSEALLTTGNGGAVISVQWQKAGVYYIMVTESDSEGCANTKALVVHVMANERTIGFELLAGNSCRDELAGGLEIAVWVQNNEGLPLEDDYFPLKALIQVNGGEHSVNIGRDRLLTINSGWFHTGPDVSAEVIVKFLSAADRQGVPVSVADNQYTHLIYSSPEIVLTGAEQDTIPLNSFYSFQATYANDCNYTWWFENDLGERTDLDSKTYTTENYFWNTEGVYRLYVQAANQNGCKSRPVSKIFVVQKQANYLPSLVALPDINVGYENSLISGNVATNDFDFMDQELTRIYTLEGNVPEGLTIYDDGYYEYQPPPGFTGKTGFTYKVCFEQLPEGCATADVEIRVLPNITSGNIAPVASTDAALTLPGRTVFSNLVVNDIDPDGFNMPLAVNPQPVYAPANGSVTINPDGSFAYTPDPGFRGIDRFLYQVCDMGKPALCDSAWVYVIVSEFGNNGQKPVSASDDMFLYIEGNVYSLRENDTALGDNLEYNTLPVVDAAHGALELYADGTFRYVPDEGYYGIDWFVYNVCNTDDEPVCRQGTGFILITREMQFVALAGKDTVIGGCDPYMLEALDFGDGFNYQWEPATLINDAQSRTPVFSPDSSTVFKLTVTNSYGFKTTGSVQIEVSEVSADAGYPVYMAGNEQAVLDGSGSQGAGIQYRWTTNDGVIVSGETTAHPVVGSTGTYILEVTDKFGCASTDSVVVGLLTWAPLPNDDYDTTGYETTLKIDVLANDTDQDNDINRESLVILTPPFSGTASVDYSDFSITYRPSENFSGNDQFTYQVCDSAMNCASANVYVLVADFRFFIPDAFSPNNDGVNDYFEILGIEQYEGNSIEIFNRWGNRVYRAGNYGISTSPQYWDGKSNTGVRLGNEELPAGTYFYVLNLGNGEKRIVGSVYLDR